MYVLELFAGSRSIGRACDQLDIPVFSTDIEPFKAMDLVQDIRRVVPSAIPFLPDVIWASPPCTAFSVAAMGRHWDMVDGVHHPRTDMARCCIELVNCAIDLIRYYREQQPDLVFFIENPRGVLRKMPFMEGFNRHTVTYCQYGDRRMKPTDIWTNSRNWHPRPMCRNGAPCHEAAPRGSRTGTQGLRNSYERSRIPDALCLEVMEACLSEHSTERRQAA